LAAWDCRLTADSAGGAVYSRLRAQLVRAAYADELDSLTLNPGGGALRWQPGQDFLDGFAVSLSLDALQAGADGWLGKDRDWDTVLATAWRAAIDRLVDEQGPDVSGWRYGRSHRMTLRHPFGALPVLRRLLNRGPYPIGGDGDTVCAGDVVVGSDGTPQLSAATYRMICDLGDWDRSRSVLPTGQSGRPGSRHYLDQRMLWLAGEHHPMPWSRPEVRRLSRERTGFVPTETQR
jgi:penicillin amidase